MTQRSRFAIGDAEWPGISKLIEEAGEVIQVCGKLLGSHGEAEHFDGSNLRQRLQEELGDLEAAIQFVKLYCQLDSGTVAARATCKLAAFEEWHKEEHRR